MIILVKSIFCIDESANYDDSDSVLIKQNEEHIGPLFFFHLFSGLAELMIWWNDLSECNSLIQLM